MKDYSEFLKLINGSPIAPAAELRVAELRLDQKRKSLLEDAEQWTRKIALEKERRSEVDKSLLEEGKQLKAKQTAFASTWRTREEDAKSEFASEKQKRADRIRELERQLVQAQEELSVAKKACLEVVDLLASKSADQQEEPQKCEMAKELQETVEAKSPKHFVKARTEPNLASMFGFVLGSLAILPMGLAIYFCFENEDALGLKALSVTAGIGSVAAAIECFKREDEFKLWRCLYVVVSLGIVMTYFFFDENIRIAFCLYYIITAILSAYRGASTRDEDLLVWFTLYSNLLVVIAAFVTGHWVVGVFMSLLGLIRFATLGDSHPWPRALSSLFFIAAGMLAWQGCFIWALGCCAVSLGFIVKDTW